MRYEVYLTRKAMKELDDIEPPSRKRILDALTSLETMASPVDSILKSLRDIRTTTG